jgi:hypothetical protein
MTQEIIEMAREVGLCRTQSNFNDWIDAGPSGYELEAFAKLIEDKVRQEIIDKNAPVIKQINEHIKELQDAIKAEREACALIVNDDRGLSDDDAIRVCRAIRARGEA